MDLAGLARVRTSSSNDCSGDVFSTPESSPTLLDGSSSLHVAGADPADAAEQQAPHCHEAAASERVLPWTTGGDGTDCLDGQQLQLFLAAADDTDTQQQAELAAAAAAAAEAEAATEAAAVANRTAAMATDLAAAKAEAAVTARLVVPWADLFPTPGSPRPRDRPVPFLFPGCQLFGGV